jgi:hypothetical protein
MLFRPSTANRSRRARELTLAALSTVGGFLAAAAVTSACAAEDPGDTDPGGMPYPEPATAAVGTTSPTGSSTSAPPGTDASVSSDASTADSGTSSTDAAPADAAPVKIITLPAIFNMAPAYDKSKVPTQSAAQMAGTKHNFSGPANPENPIGQDCSTCHSPGNSASSFQWLIGGSIVDSKSNGISGAEVVMVDGDGGVVAVVYSDADGNFWTSRFLADGGTVAVPQGAQVMVRIADNEDNYMPSTKVINAAAFLGCSSAACHGGSQGLPHVP